MSGTKIDESGRVTPMRVIVCGVHRTGSLSVRTALRQLGFNDCYHMHKVMENANTHPQMWTRAVEAKYAGRGEFTKQDWDELLGDCQACADLPAALFGPELAEAYPEAKVVILNRDPEKWYYSALTSAWTVLRPPTRLSSRLAESYLCAFDQGTYNFTRMVAAIGRWALPFDHGKEKDKALRWFNKQYQEFRNRIPEDRRIEYRVQDGWAPLCAHLGVPVPMIKDEATGEMVETPFPRVNDQDDFTKRIAHHKNVLIKRANDNFFSLFGKLTLVGSLGIACFLACKVRFGGRF